MTNSPLLHVAFVCSFNIGRSPIAAAMFADWLREVGLGDVVRVSSAGTSTTGGSPMDVRGAEALRANGYPVPLEHQSARLNADHMAADLVVAMTGQHVYTLAGLGVPTERLRLLRSFDPNLPACIDVKNPYTADDFKHCFTVIESALPGLLEYVIKQLVARCRLVVAS